jgi:hypothetical protein
VPNAVSMIKRLPDISRNIGQAFGEHGQDKII